MKLTHTVSTHTVHQTHTNTCKHLQEVYTHRPHAWPTQAAAEQPGVASCSRNGSRFDSQLQTGGCHVTQRHTCPPPSHTHTYLQHRHEHTRKHGSDLRHTLLCLSALFFFFFNGRLMFASQIKSKSEKVVQGQFGTDTVTVNMHGK